MERTTVDAIKELFGDNFIGIDELKPLFLKMGLSLENLPVPDIHYSMDELKKCSKDYILILGLSEVGNTKLSINTFRTLFGVNPDISEPCFYNQDWYLQEDFINRMLDTRWYLLKKEVVEESRAVQPSELLKQDISFPSAVLCIYTFFAYFFANGELLWYHDFIWCSDTDHNGDRIYVGKYHDVDGVNKNGFSIHRHLALRSCYGSVCVKGGLLDEYK